MSSLPNSRRLIARAKEHRDDLEKKFREWWTTHENTAFFEPDPQNLNHVLAKVRVEGAIPIDSFANSTYDAISNLRASLDSAGYSLALGACKSRLRYTAFPFADDASKFEDQIKGRSKDIPEEIYPFFRAYKPYRGGNNFLWALNEACNSHKHQSVIKLAIATGLGNAQGTGGLVRLLLPPGWDSTKQEFEIGTFIAGLESNYQIEISGSIAFDKIEFIDGEPAGKVVNYFIDIVEHIISTLETEGTRLGFLK